MDNLPDGEFDLLLLGDSLVEFWPEELWHPWRIFNMGAAADKTQHLLWRLDQIAPHRIKPKFILVMVNQ